MLITVLVAGATAQGSEHPANVQWEEFLPALPSPTEIQPRSVPNCRKASIRCIDVEIKRLRARQRKWGCDHRAVFATTYLELTKELRQLLRERPDFLRYPKYLYTEDALFANVYFNAIRAARRGKPVPPAWEIAFDAAKSKDLNAAQDMLLGINAHVQNDMPFVLAALGLRTRGGESRKTDHDAINQVLDRSYERRRARGARPLRPAGRAHEQRLDAARRRRRARARQGLARDGVAERGAAAERERTTPSASRSRSRSSRTRRTGRAASRPSSRTAIARRATPIAVTSSASRDRVSS